MIHSFEKALNGSKCRACGKPRSAAAHRFALTARWDSGCVYVFSGQTLLATVCFVYTPEGRAWRVHPVNPSRPQGKLFPYPAQAIDSYFGGRTKIKGRQENV
jgi:hypothetical protein